MIIDKHTHIKLTPEELKDIIKKHLATKGYDADINNIQFNIDQGGMYESATFKGCSIIAY